MAISCDGIGTVASHHEKQQKANLEWRDVFVYRGVCEAVVREVQGSQGKTLQEATKRLVRTCHLRAESQESQEGGANASDGDISAPLTSTGSNPDAISGQVQRVEARTLLQSTAVHLALCSFFLCILEL